MAVHLLLPTHPNLDHLKGQAKDLLRAHRAGEPSALAESRAFLPQRTGELKLSDAQCIIARRYSFRSWPRLNHFIETYDTHAVTPAATRLRQAIDGERLAEIRQLVADQPDLLDEHVARSAQHYRNHRPLAYACQTNHPDVVALLLELGADPSADGYLAVARASMSDDRLPVLRILFNQGIDPNIDVYDWGPLLLYPCECLAPGVIRFLLAKGASPTRGNPQGRCTQTPMQMVLSTYGRSSAQADCIEALIAGGATFEDSPIMDIHRNRRDALAQRIAADPGLVHTRFANLDYGQTGGRSLSASGGTLLHVAAEFGALDAARLLLDHGAKVDARADTDAAGHGGQTPLFHAVSQYHTSGLELTRLLLDHGADPTVRCTIRGSCDQPDDVVTCTPLGYALRFPPDRPTNDPTLSLLRQHHARE